MPRLPSNSDYDLLRPSAKKQKVTQKYTVLNDKFAKGNFGEIILATDADNKEVVLKRIPKSTDPQREIEAGKRMEGCPHVAKFIEYMEGQDAHFLVFELVHGKDLFSTIEERKFTPFKEKEVKKMFKQILGAIEYAHKKGVTHRDIKLENILMDSQTGAVKVIDFGLCDLVKKGEMSERFCGSVDYVAPEILQKKAYDSYISDVFSLGVVLYTLLYAEFPFSANERLASIANNKPHPKLAFVDNKFLNYPVSDAAKDLITKMLQPEYSKRITLEEVRKHSFLKSGLFS